MFELYVLYRRAASICFNSMYCTGEQRVCLNSMYCTLPKKSTVDRSSYRIIKSSAKVEIFYHFFVFFILLICLYPINTKTIPIRFKFIGEREYF